MRLTISLSILSLLALSACGSAVKRPDADVKYINRAGLKFVIYNALTDYDDEGNRKPEAKPREVRFSSADEMLVGLSQTLHACFDTKGQTEMKRVARETYSYIKLLKDRCAERCWGL